MAHGGSSSSDAAALSERRAWLFAGRPRHWRGIDVDLLDPSDPGDRALLVRADHAEAEEDDQEDSAGAAQSADVPGRGTNSLRMHLAVHEVVANQVWDGDPPEVGEAADRLRALGHDRHDILHMLGSVVAEEIGRVGAGGAPFDSAERTRRLDALPGSWEELRRDDDEYDDEEEYDEDEYDEDDDLLSEVHHLLAARGPLTVGEVAEALDVDDEEEVEELLVDPALVFVSDGRLVSAVAILDGVTLTHRLSRAEADQRVVEVGPGLSPLEAASCGEDHLHLAGGGIVDLPEAYGGPVHLSLDDLGLPLLGEGTLIGFHVSLGDGDVPTVEPLVVDEVPRVRDSVLARLQASFERLGDGEGMPVTPLELLCQLLVDEPALASEPLAPLDELLEGAGFEVRDGHTAPAGTDWAAFEQVQNLAAVVARRGLGVHEAHALTALVQAVAPSATGGGRDGRPDKDAGAAFAHFLCDSELAEAFAEAVWSDPGPARSFPRYLRAVGGRRHEAGLWWCESLVLGRAGNVEAAEACVRSAIAHDPGHQPALRDAAWYASDRGDAADAAQLLERAEDEEEGDGEDAERVALLRQFAPAKVAGAVRAGRNDPCPCGSGRKYKQCCLARPSGVPDAPLGARVRWLWEKMRWWLGRFGPIEDVFAVALVLQGTRTPVQPMQLAVDLDLAASLVLFADGAVAEFLAQRSPLLPVDEANIAAQWALSGPSVHEVGNLRAGEGFSLRDLRSGDVVDVRERSGSRSLRDGDLVFAHPVFDGAGYQIVGGIVPVTLLQRGPLMDLLDADAGALDIADELARTRRVPTLVNMEGEPTVLCEGTYRLDDPVAASAALDATLERQENGVWAEMAPRGEQRWVRARVSIDGDTLRLWANSEARFERVKDALTHALGTLDPLGESREPVEAAARRARDEPSGDELLGQLPEVAAAMEQFMRQREVAWLDETVPALGGLTPRQAAADPTRHEDLVALLHEYEGATLPEGALSYDVNRLRELLGLRGS